jgi:hypothetical protein
VSSAGKGRMGKRWEKKKSLGPAEGKGKETEAVVVVE